MDNMALNVGETSIQVPAGSHVTVSFDNDVVLANKDSIAKVAMRQAEERTKLVVECASLVKRMAQLDEEMVQYDEWQRYPTAHYADRVQMRFEEARRREAAAARRGALGGRGHVTALMDLVGPDAHAPTSPRSPQSQSGVVKVTVHGGGEERKGSAACLGEALQAANFEAGVWRQRAYETAREGAREREQVLRLMQFDLQSALKAAEEERERLYARVLEQETAAKRARAELEASEAALGLAKQRGDQHQAACVEQMVKCEALARTVAEKDKDLAAKDKDLVALRLDLTDCRESSEAKLKKFSVAVAAAEEAARREVDSAREAGLVARRELLEARAEGERLGVDLQGLRAELQTSKAEAHAAAERLQDALSRSEAQCHRLGENLAILREELNTARSEGEATRGQLREAREDGEARCRQLTGALGRVEGELQEAAAGREAARQELQETRADGDARCNRLIRELAGVRGELDSTIEQAESLRAQVREADLQLRAERDLHAREVEAAREERDAKVRAAQAAHRQAEMMSAQVDNLQAALESSTNKQVDLAMEKEALKDRTRRLETVLSSPPSPRHGSSLASATLGLTLPLSPGGSAQAPTTFGQGRPQSAKTASPEASTALHLPSVGAASPTRTNSTHTSVTPATARGSVGDPSPSSLTLTPTLKSLPQVQRPQSARGLRKD